MSLKLTEHNEFQSVGEVGGVGGHPAEVAAGEVSGGIEDSESAVSVQGLRGGLVREVHTVLQDPHGLKNERKKDIYCKGGRRKKDVSTIRGQETTDTKIRKIFWNRLLPLTLRMAIVMTSRTPQTGAKSKGVSEAREARKTLFT